MPQISNHPLVELLSKNTISSDEKFKETFLENYKKGDIESGVNFSMDKEEEFHWDVSIEVNKLVASFRRIKNVQDFLSIPSEDIPDPDEKISRLVWLTYHYSSFIWTAVMLADLSLLLTNIVFDLGILPKHCRMRLILDHKFVSDKAKDSLNDLDKEVNKYRETRNLLLHRGDPPDMDGTSELVVLEALENTQPDIFQSRTEEHYQKVRDSLLEDISKKSDILENLVSKLFDALKPSYEEKWGKIKGDLIQKTLSNYKQP